MQDRFGTKWAGEPGTIFWRRPHLSRRVLFRHLPAAVGGYFLLPTRPMETVARAAEPLRRAKYCVLVLMAGGPSHADTFDLKTGAWTPGAFAPTPFEGVLWPQGLMPRLAENLDSVALVRSVRSWAVVHELSRNWVLIGRNPVESKSKIAPHMGSVVSMELGPSSADKTLPAFLALNTGTDMPGSGYFSPEHAPFFVAPGGGGLPNTAHREGQAGFERRFDLLLKLDAEERAAGVRGPAPAEMAQFAQAARGLMYNPRVTQTFSFSNDDRLRYGNSGFGNACITARNLIKSGMGTRFVQITVGGWDNHAGIYGGAFNAGNANSLVRQFDNGLGNLIADLKREGLLEETLIVALGEFGRTVGPLNAQGGRDHFPQQAVLFAGAGIRGPKAIGVTDDRASETLDPAWSRGRYVRNEDISATIYSALGIDWTTVRRDDPLGRGFEYVPWAASEDRYGPVNELWG